MPDPQTSLAALTWQFDMVWGLAEYHLPALTDEMCLWEAGSGAWNVRRLDDVWVADWADQEPDPAPPVTIGWVSWHIAWWWSGALATAAGETAPGHREVQYPGSAEGVRAQLGALAGRWREILGDLDESSGARPCAFPWPEERPFATTVAWAHAELMKNVAEIGVLRHIYEARAV